MICPSLLSVPLQGANANLRDRLHEASAQAEAAKAQVTALQGFQSSLQASAGPSADALIEAAVGRERALQDARNQKVLELLNNKVLPLCISLADIRIASLVHSRPNMVAHFGFI